MKGIQFLLILFLVPGLPLFQVDQTVDIAWLVCENSLSVKLEIEGPPADQNLSFNLEPPCRIFNQVKSFFQLKNPLSVLLSYFQGPSPFWRPPPGFHPLLYYPKGLQI
jgi:hypothetical protein